MPDPSAYCLGDPEEIGELEVWIESWAPLPEGIENRLALQKAIRDDLSFRRAEELLEVGLWEEALFEFGKVRRRFQNDPSPSMCWSSPLPSEELRFPPMLDTDEA